MVEHERPRLRAPVVLTLHHELAQRRDFTTRIRQLSLDEVPPRRLLLLLVLLLLVEVILLVLVHHVCRLTLEAFTFLALSHERPPRLLELGCDLLAALAGLGSVHLRRLEQHLRRLERQPLIHRAASTAVRAGRRQVACMARVLMLLLLLVMVVVLVVAVAVGVVVRGLLVLVMLLMVLLLLLLVLLLLRV
jgi:hypothetical protein